MQLNVQLKLHLYTDLTDTTDVSSCNLPRQHLMQRNCAPTMHADTSHVTLLHYHVDKANNICHHEQNA